MNRKQDMGMNMEDIRCIFFVRQRHKQKELNPRNLSSFQLSIKTTAQLYDKVLTEKSRKEFAQKTNIPHSDIQNHKVLSSQGVELRYEI